eukprot:UN09120
MIECQKNNMAASVGFDEKGKVRIIPSEQSELCLSIVQSTKSFVNCVNDFESIIQQHLIAILQTKSTELEKTKLLAIGLNNRIINETEQRKEKENELTSIIKSNKNILKQLNMKYDSLCNVENKQNNTLTKLLKL